jgi:hypothetical protein
VAVFGDWLIPCRCQFDIYCPLPYFSEFYPVRNCGRFIPHDLLPVADLPSRNQQGFLRRLWGVSMCLAAVVAHAPHRVVI